MLKNLRTSSDELSEFEGFKNRNNEEMNSSEHLSHSSSQLARRWDCHNPYANDNMKRLKKRRFKEIDNAWALSL